jgi:D-lactate dehydrogenase (cytochrome)
MVSAISWWVGTKLARSSEAFRNPLNNDWSTYPLRRAMPARYGGKEAWEKALPLLKRIVGEEHVVMDDDELVRHATSSWSSYIPTPGARYEPHCIVYPETTEQISDIARVAHKYKLAIIPFSGGTSLEGHFSGPRGGICLDYARMDKIVAIHEEDLDAVVQPCVGWEDLNDVLNEKGLWFPVDPGPGAKIGGMVGTGCSGTNAGRYGTMREWVINLTVVLADGTIIKTRQRPRKSSAGYDLTKLFIGSEGTLGLVTEICVKLAVMPAETSVAVVPFPSIKDAASTVAQTVRSGVDIAAMELLDDNQMRTINMTKATTRTWAEQPTLFIKFAGTKSGVREAIGIVGKIAKENNGGKFEFAKNEKDKKDLWSARKVYIR